MSTQVFFIESQAKDVLLVPMSAVSFFQPRGMRPQGNSVQSEKSQNKKTSAKNTGMEITGAETAGVETTGDRKARRDDFGEHRRGAAIPRPASVKVMNENGEVEERNVLVGVTNRVQAQIIEGLKEGEKVVSGSTKPNQTKVAPAGGFGGPGMGRR
jgi:membrane fusion protein, macrolide-specific efflux system